MATPALPPCDARRNRRFSFARPVRLGWIGEERRMRYCIARGIDISGSGIAVQLNERLRLSALVHIELQSGSTGLGRVCYCVPRNGHWRAGIQLVGS